MSGDPPTIHYNSLIFNLANQSNLTSSMMNSIRWKFIVTLTLIIFLGAGIQFSDSNSLQAQVPKVTASAVVGDDGIVNEDSLKAFVTWVASEFEKLDDLDDFGLTRKKVDASFTHYRDFLTSSGIRSSMLLG